MKSFLLLAILSTVVCVSTSTCTATFYVDGSVSSSGDGASWGTALKTIQEGIDAASDGDTVTVAEAAYVENIQFKGENIALTSTDQLDPTVVANTIIDGNQENPVVTFTGTEDETCLVAGFTLRNGRGLDWRYGGGIYGRGTHATIRRNIITLNRLPST